MDALLNFNSTLSVEELALRRVVANLWIEIDSLPEFQELELKNYSQMEWERMWKVLCKLRNMKHLEWREAVKKIDGKVSKLTIPNSIKKRMRHIVKPIGMDICGWKMIHEKILYDSEEYFDMRILEQLCWTSEVAVDYMKTAENIVRHETIDIETRYILACSYCLEDCIPLLWEKLPENFKGRFNDELGFLVQHEPLEFYWAYVLKGESSKLDNILQSISSFHKYAFQFSAKKGNLAATEYFFKKLSEEERESSLFGTVCSIIEETSRNLQGMHSEFPQKKYSGVLRYLLSVMTAEQQMRILKRDPSGILNCFLDWPWQDLFLDIADLIWTFLPAYKYGDIQWKMIDNFKNSDYYLPNLFQKFFLRSPRDFKKYIMSIGCEWGSYFTEIFLAEDTETIELVFRNIDADDRWAFVSSSWFFNYFICSTTENNLYLAELCLREATLSREDRARLKEIFNNFLPEAATFGMIQRQKHLKCFLDSIDKTNTSACSNLYLEDGTPTQS